MGLWQEEVWRAVPLETNSVGLGVHFIQFGSRAWFLAPSQQPSLKVKQHPLWVLTNQLRTSKCLLAIKCYRSEDQKDHYNQLFLNAGREEILELSLYSFASRCLKCAHTHTHTYLTNRWMDKEDVLHIYNEILLYQKKEWNNAICSNMDGPRDYHMKWSKSERGQALHGIT